MTTPYTTETIAEMLSRITQGEWTWSYHPDNPEFVVALDTEHVDVLLCTGDHDRAWGEINEADASFIAAAPTIVRRLLAENKQLKERLQQ